MLLTSEKACPYDFFNSLLIFNILNKTSIQFFSIIQQSNSKSMHNEIINPLLFRATHRPD